MGITSALYSGVSGLNANSQAMSVIGNNLANTNTLGFKGSRSVFSDMLSSTISGSGGSSQVGRGVNISKVDSIFSQGTFESTASDTDVAIEGEGFFVLKEEGNNTALYSRAGAFRFNQDGYLVNPEGYRVQGKFHDVNGDLIAGDPGDILVEDVGLRPAQATGEVNLNFNLDSSAIVLAPAYTVAGAYDPENNPIDPASINYSSSSLIYDSLGESHLMTMYFSKTAANNWDVYWSGEDAAGLPLVADPLAAPLAGGNGVPLIFDANGRLLDINGVNDDDPNYIPVTAPLAGLNFNNGSAAMDVEIAFDTTQFNSVSTVIGQDQDGFAAGNLTNVGVNEEGTVVASYSNGEQNKIATLVLAKFNNPGGLELVGSNMFIGTEYSGAPRTGLPGPELGKVFTNSLEQSNVDTGQQFVKMITTQRGFQANSKIITTVDELLGELINLKR